MSCNALTKRLYIDLSYSTLIKAFASVLEMRKGAVESDTFSVTKTPFTLLVHLSYLSVR